jgi:S1-C subfamily serine protease
MIGMALLAWVALAPPWVESQDFSRAAQEKALAATLRLRNPASGGEGSAVRLGRVGPHVYYLTAAHNIGQSNVVDLETFTVRSYPKPDRKMQLADVDKVWPECDLALLRSVVVDEGPAATLIPRDKTPKNGDFAALSVGCTNGAEPELVQVRVTGAKRVHKPDGSSGWYWETEKPSAPGRSGGPLIDRNGHLIGICSGMDGAKAYYVHADDIRKQLDRSVRRFLLAPPPQPAGKGE